MLSVAKREQQGDGVVHQQLPKLYVGFKPQLLIISSAKRKKMHQKPLGRWEGKFLPSAKQRNILYLVIQQLLKLSELVEFAYVSLL